MPSPKTSVLFALGACGTILRYGEHVLKVPRADDPEFREDCCRDLIREKAIYTHLGHSSYIVDWFENDNGIEMARMDGGDMEIYISSHAKPSRRVLQNLLQQLVDAHCYVHDKGIILYDSFPRNILFDEGGVNHDNLSLKLCDFGNSIKLPAQTDISTVVIDGTSAQIDIFNLGWLMYSLVKWELNSFDLFGPRDDIDIYGSEAADSDNDGDDDDEPSWPQEFPDTSELLCGDIIRKFWTKHAYMNMHAIRDALFKEFGVII